MTKNPILDELHAVRERLLAESGGTIAGLAARVRANQQAPQASKQRGEGSDKAANQTQDSEKPTDS